MGAIVLPPTLSTVYLIGSLYGKIGRWGEFNFVYLVHFVYLMSNKVHSVFGDSPVGRYLESEMKKRAYDAFVGVMNNATEWQPTWSGPREDRRRRRNVRKARSGPTIGSAGRAYPYPRYRRPSKFAKYGVIHKLENRAVVADPDAVYVGGCTLPAEGVLQATASAIIRLLFAKTQFAMVDEHRSIKSEGGNPGLALTLIYKLSPAGNAVSAGSVSGTAGWTTYRAAASALVGLFYTAGGAASSFLEFIEIRLSGDGVGGATALTLNSTLNPNDTVIELSGKVACQIQNRTPASTGSTDVGDSDNINANPLRGKVYKGRGTHFSFRFNTDDTGNAPIIQANQETGILFLEANNPDIPANMQNVIKKPPPAYTFANMYGQAYFRQDPGRIRKLACSSKMRFKLNSLVAMMLPYLLVGVKSVGGANPLGHTVVCGLEKLCDLEIGVPPAEVTVGVEIVSTICAVAWKKGRNLINPYTVIQ